MMRTSIVIPGTDRPYVDGDSLDLSAPLVLRVDDFLRPAECAEQIERIAALGPAVAPITTPRGFVMAPDIRNNERVMFDDPGLAQALFERIGPALPPVVCGCLPVGVNERFRGYRYRPGQRFAPHYDGSFVRDRHERSLLTFMIYLDEGAEGGATAFLDHDVEVVPRQGTALLFQHLQLHEGATLRRGVKHVLRTDVMYRDEIAARARAL
jgi:hypothetical protein